MNGLDATPHRTSPGLPLAGEAAGPFQPGDVLAVGVLRRGCPSVQPGLFHPLTWPRPP